MFFALFPAQFFTVFFFYFTHRLNKSRDSFIKDAYDFFTHSTSVFKRIVEKRRGDDIVIRPILGDQKRYREEVRDVRQRLCLFPHLTVMLLRRKLYRPFYLRRMVHYSQSIGFLPCLAR